MKLRGNRVESISRCHHFKIEIVSFLCKIYAKFKIHEKLCGKKSAYRLELATTEGVNMAKRVSGGIRKSTSTNY